MCRIAGSPQHDNAYHSYDIQRELSLTFPAKGKKSSVRGNGVSGIFCRNSIFHDFREVYSGERGSQGVQ